MKRIFTISTFVLVFCFNGFLYSQTDSTRFDNGFQFEASYLGDNVNNVHGGIKRGSAFLGMANLRLLFDTEKAGLWSGSQFFVNAVNTHGATPSAEMLGDMQVASNIEAGNHTYIQELWYKQVVGNVEFTLGLQDLNVEFAVSENGGLFLNSSFGILPVISANVPAPIFPLTSLGITSKWSINDKTAWLNAIYDGSPSDFDYNPYNLNWQFASGDGILAVTELQRNVEVENLPGVYKLGLYSHNHLIEKQFNSDFPDSLDHSKYGFYMYADQRVFQRGETSIDIFSQFGYSPSELSLNRVFFSFGVNLKGLMTKSDSDILGFAVAHANYNESVGGETSLELTYQRQITKNIFIQPDLQYIINPSGKSSGISNCFAGTLRLGLSF